MDYIVRGRMIGGFALVAYPAEYDNSGVMTFIVNQDGVVYEKDLGPNTLGSASNMTAFDPDQSWRKVVNDGAAAGPLPKFGYVAAPDANFGSRGTSKYDSSAAIDLNS